MSSSYSQGVHRRLRSQKIENGLEHYQFYEEQEIQIISYPWNPQTPARMCPVWFSVFFVCLVRTDYCTALYCIVLYCDKL